MSNKRKLADTDEKKTLNKPVTGTTIASTVPIKSSTHANNTSDKKIPSSIKSSIIKTSESSSKKTFPVAAVKCTSKTSDDLPIQSKAKISNKTVSEAIKRVPLGGFAPSSASAAVSVETHPKGKNVSNPNTKADPDQPQTKKIKPTIPHSHSDPTGDPKGNTSSSSSSTAAGAAVVSTSTSSSPSSSSVHTNRKPEYHFVIIGSAGRSNDNHWVSKESFERCVGIAQSHLTKIESDGFKCILKSGGSSFSDHVAVQLYLRDPVNRRLHLYLPCPFDYTEKQFTVIKGLYSDPAWVLNTIHTDFHRKTGIDSLGELSDAMKHEAKTCHVFHSQERNFLARNLDLSASRIDRVVAFSSVKNGIKVKNDTKVLEKQEKVNERLERDRPLKEGPSDSGTAMTWGNIKKRHPNITKFMEHYAIY